MEIKAIQFLLLLHLTIIRQIVCDSEADCQFDKKADGSYSTCNYNLTLGVGHHCFSWDVCNGKDAHWRGGPSTDGAGSSQGGYVFIELSAMASYKTMNKSRMAWLMTPKFPPTKAVGRCMKFQYNIKGLSSQSLNIRLFDILKNTSYVVWEKSDTTLGKWKNGQVSFTSGNEYKVVFEAVPNPKNPLMRGHIAVDNIEITESACPGDCMFDSDVCTWTNVNGTDELDFIMGRGSTNIVTGPTSDHTSQSRNGMTGGYIYLDSTFPRGPGDKAQLISQQFSATDPNGPSCMKFWISVYGPGIGTISVQLLDVANKTKTPPIWKLTNEKFDNSLNIWHEARTTISYPRPFKVVIEAVVGESDTGDIGIDDVSFLDGPCPSQCSFLDERCEWVVYPIVQELNSRPMWSVVYGTNTLLQPDGHTNMDNSNRHGNVPQRRSKSQYMYSSSKSELGIGSLGIVHHSGNKNTTLWSLAGSQNSRWFYAQTSFRTKSISDKLYQKRPRRMKLTALSSWIPAHGQSQTVITGNDPRWTWTKPRKLNGPRLVRDHTFDIETDGFIFFEVLEAPEKIETELRSPIFSVNDTVCLTFYYAAYSSEDGASLRVISRGGVEKEWWNVTRSVNDEAAGRATPKWKYGQVEIKNDQDFMIIFKAKVRISAFALDDIKIRLGAKNCPSKPQVAVRNSRHSYRSSSRQGRLIDTTSNKDTSQDSTSVEDQTVNKHITTETEPTTNAERTNPTEKSYQRNTTNISQTNPPTDTTAVNDVSQETTTAEYQSMKETTETVPVFTTDRSNTVEVAYQGNTTINASINETTTAVEYQVSSKHTTTEGITSTEEAYHANATITGSPSDTTTRPSTPESTVITDSIRSSPVDYKTETSTEEEMDSGNVESRNLAYLEEVTEENFVSYYEPDTSYARKSTNGYSQLPTINALNMFSEFYTELEKYSKKVQEPL
ncbi:MAM and LDL-receptor class A domain-containing protein 1 [Nymphon striatum]|nr:MAM and LDL-receptor class A domain-containing protein 1 [Nymphon striatum]